MRTHRFGHRLKPYFKELSGKGPFGGGSSAAAAGALGAALLLKAIAYSLSGKTGEARKKLHARKREALRIRTGFSSCVDRDAALFSAYMTATGKKRKQAALRRSAQLVLSVCDLSRAGVACIKKTYKSVKPWIFSDIMVSFLLFDAALRSSWCNVVINNRVLKDTTLSRAAEEILRTGEENKKVWRVLQKEFLDGAVAKR